VFNQLNAIFSKAISVKRFEDWKLTCFVGLLLKLAVTMILFALWQRMKKI